MTYLDRMWLSVKPLPQSGPLRPNSVKKVGSELTLEGGKSGKNGKEGEGISGGRPSRGEACR